MTDKPDEIKKISSGFSMAKKPFRHAGRLQKSPEAEQLAPVGVHRYGRARVAMEVKILAKQAGL